MDTHINSRRRALIQRHILCAFTHMVNGAAIAVDYYKYLSNAVALAAFGDAVPTFDEPVEDVLALVEDDPVEQTHSIWGVDERSTRVLYLLASTFDALGVTNRDHFTIAGERFQVLRVLREMGMGHEVFAVPILLAPATDTVGAPLPEPEPEEP